jgi:predicted AAA+ superfamily ATPase
MRKDELFEILTVSYKGHEVDFVVKKGLEVCQLIQVCSNIENQETKERETKSLIRALYEFSVDTGMIITDDFEAEEVINGREIICEPLWVFV